MNRFFKYYKGRKGITLVWMAFMLAVLLMLAGMAIDIAYMYYVKNQLQVAADAAALAGAARLDGTNSTAQPAARAEAVTFAAKNSAAGTPVVLASNGDNTLSNSNDITVGNWSPSLTPKYLAGRTPINAVEVMARRTSGSPGGQVSLFIGQIFRILDRNGTGTGWSFMSARASAIASRPPRAVAPIAICLDTCVPGVISPTGTLLYWSPYATEVDPGDVGIAWTSFNPNLQLMEKDIINSFFCGAEKDACNLTVYTNNGYDNDLARQFRCAFKNPLHDSDYKTCADGKCDSISDNVTSWNVLVPIFVSPGGCPPGDQPAPETIVAYGRLNIIEVYASGGGGTNKCACGAYDATSLNGPNAILVNSIECIACPATEIFGRRPVLVK